MVSVHEEFRQARIHAARHMVACEQAGLRWGETSITEVVTAHAARAATVVPFTQRAEALSGADWVWWWVDGADAYGMLVQAKRVTVTGSRWSFDFGYKARGAVRRQQREVLRSTAAELGLLPVYALYLGTGAYRRWERCSEDHRSGRCLSCVKRTISLMPALLADELIVSDATSTYVRSVALEDLLAPPRASALLIPALERQLLPELLDFLQKRQDGTRAVARSMIDRVLRVRFEVSASSTRATSAHYGVDDQFGPVFGDVPDDTGHWGARYFEHALSPLRHTPPDYVRQIIAGDFDEDHLALNMDEDRSALNRRENIAGIVVVRVPQHGEQ